MRIIEQSTIKSLGRDKPATTSAVYVTEHTRSFYCFLSTDVWTADGWLVTAVQDNGVHHLLKGDQRCTAEMGPDEILHYNPTQQTLLHGFGAVPLPNFVVTIYAQGGHRTMQADGYDSAYHAARWAASCLGDGPVHKHNRSPGFVYRGKMNVYVVTQA